MVLTLEHSLCVCFTTVLIHGLPHCFDGSLSRQPHLQGKQHIHSTSTASALASVIICFFKPVYLPPLHKHSTFTGAMVTCVGE